MSQNPDSKNVFLNLAPLELQSCLSTQDQARTLAQQSPASQKTIHWVQSEEQSQGRGRRSRTWISHTDALMCSAAIHSDFLSSKELSFIPLIAGKSLFETAQKFTDDGRLTLKWPNDLIFLDQQVQKIAGIICELKSKILCVGWGLNLNKAPKEISHAAALNRSEKALSKEIVFQALRESFLKEINHLKKTPENYLELLIDYLNETAMKKTWNRKILYEQKEHGIARRLSPSGHLLIESKTPQGETLKTEISSGDILIR